MSVDDKEGGGDPIVDGKIPGPETRSLGEDSWVLRLYIAGRTERYIRALEDLRRICDQHLPDRYRIEVIDLLEVPRPDTADQVLAVPTVVRVLPPPTKRIVGELSDAERVRWALDLGLPGSPKERS